MNENSPLLSIETQSLEEVPSLGTRSEQDKTYASISNVLVGSVTGMVYMTNFVNIGLLADKLGTTSVKMGSVFIGEAVAAVLGGLFWPSLSQTMGTANAVVTCLLLLGIVCLTIMLSNSLILMYFLFFFIGMCNSFLDTASLSTIRVVHEGDHRAGPWLSGMSISYLLGGLFAVLLNALISSVTTIYSIVVFWILVALVFNWFYQDRISQPTTTAVDKIVWSNYLVEIIVGLVLGLLDGSTSSLTSYMETYIDETGVVNTSRAGYVVLVFWIAMLLGNVVVLLTQSEQSTESLMLQQIVAVVLSVVVLFFMLIYSTNAIYLWVSMVILGFCNSISFNVLLDVSNRLCQPTALSGTIVFFGVSLGISGIPYVVSAIWDYSGAGAASLIYVLMVLQLLTLVVHIAPKFRHIE